MEKKEVVEGVEAGLDRRTAQWPGCERQASQIILSSCLTRLLRDARRVNASFLSSYRLVKMKHSEWLLPQQKRNLYISFIDRSSPTTCTSPSYILSRSPSPPTTMGLGDMDAK